MTTRQNVLDFIASEFTSKDSVIESDRLEEDLAMDSLDLVNLQILLDKEFEVQASDYEIEGLKTAKDVCDLVLNKKL